MFRVGAFYINFLFQFFVCLLRIDVLFCGTSQALFGTLLDDDDEIAYFTVR